jgi:hypothetical protein
MRGPLVIETYGIDLLEGAKKPALDNSSPPELHWLKVELHSGCGKPRGRRGSPLDKARGVGRASANAGRPEALGRRRPGGDVEEGRQTWPLGGTMSLEWFE